jgi:protein-S-isoprenylcysteine O-methyltransferase Ste14
VSAAVAALGIPFYFRRLFLEERVLLAELEGYREYAQRVRWRLVPRVW